jgi:hypothetical protein
MTIEEIFVRFLGKAYSEFIFYYGFFGLPRD